MFIAASTPLYRVALYLYHTLTIDVVLAQVNKQSMTVLIASKTAKEQG